MVRGFPHYHAVVQDGLHAFETHVLTKSSFVPRINNRTSAAPTQCRRAHRTHPLGVFYGDDPLAFSFSLFLVEIVFVIFVTRIIRFLLKPLKQPRIVSEILGGLFIGPTILGHDEKLSKKLFPDNGRFVLTNIGIIGFMFFLFVSGVKIDILALRKVGKKHLYSAVIGFVFPVGAMTIVGCLVRSSLDGNLREISGILQLGTYIGVTSFPVIYLILQEFNLLSSEVGRMALSSSLVSTVLGIFALIPFGALKQAEAAGIGSMFWFLISLAVLGFFVAYVVPRILGWIVEKTPEGKPVNQGCVVLIFMGVFFMGFWSDMLGIAIIHGSFWLGLAIPDGPPLGATLVERSETLVMEFLMPFSFALVGFQTDLFAMARYGWSNLAPLFAMVMTGYASKLIVTLLTAIYFQIPLKDSLTLSLIMILKGQVEVMLFSHLLEEQVLLIPAYSMMVILITGVTGICTSLINFLYDPTRPYMANKRRTIQHTPPDAELRIVLCIHDEECVALLLNLLDISYPTQASPFTVFAVHLVELVGRAAPVFIDNDQPEEVSKYIDHDKIHHALQLYQETRSDYVSLRSFTVMSPKRTMYQDICEVAMENKATFIILPFRRQRLENLAGTEIVRHAHGMQSVNSNVLAHSPCSVGILVDKGHAHNPLVRIHTSSHSVQKHVLIFLGGADSREALTYADRIAMRPNVMLMVVRFLSLNNVGDNEMEKKLDDGVVTWFWVKNEGNENVLYREVVVQNGEETLSSIRSLIDDNVDLWIVGRSQGINPVLLQGLCRWGENPELGVIGDYVSSDDFDSPGSVLVIHQQILRG